MTFCLLAPPGAHPRPLGGLHAFCGQQGSVGHADKAQSTVGHEAQKVLEQHPQSKHMKNVWKAQRVRALAGAVGCARGWQAEPVMTLVSSHGLCSVQAT